MKPGWRISFRKDRLLFFVIPVLVAAFFLVVKLRTRFFVGQNDFWSLLFYARHLSWSEKASLYNGFYPIGYALLLRFFPYSYVIQLASLTNALFAGLLGASVFGLVWSTRRLGASIFALLLTVLFPLAFQYSTYLVPDIGSAALTAWAVFLLFKSELDNDHPSHSTNWQYGLAGIALGAASLWRSHAIISSLAIIVVYGLIHRMPFRRGYAILLVAFFIVAGIQPIVNLISGHGAFETAQKFNLYKTFYGIDWRTPPSVETIQDFSVFRALMESPHSFISIYFGRLIKLVVYAFVPLLGFFLVSGKAKKRFAIFATLVIVLYALPVAAGGSPRSPLPLVGIFFGMLGLILASLFRVAQSHKNRWLAVVIPAAMGILVILLIGFWAKEDLRFVRKSASTQISLQAIQRILTNRGLRSADQMFTDRYDIYLPNVIPYYPRIAGGWDQDWLWGYKEEYPPLPVQDSLDTFLGACVAQGIRFLVLSPDAGRLNDSFLYLYESEVEWRGTDARLVFVKKVGPLKVFEVLLTPE